MLVLCNEDAVRGLLTLPPPLSLHRVLPVLHGQDLGAVLVEGVLHDVVPGVVVGGLLVAQSDSSKRKNLLQA